MAPNRVCLPLLWGLTLFLHGAMSLCNVTCWTDYELLLNCSCSGSVPTHPVQVEVVCSDFEVEVSGSCEVKAPQSWCTVENDLESVASVGTKCITSVKQRDDHDIIKVIESSTWELSDVVKPQAPLNVRVTNVDGFYNISWNNADTLGCLTYRVRISGSNGLSKDPALSFELADTFKLLKHKLLQQNVIYTVEVQARTCPETALKGPWSEWSSSAEWRTTGTSAETEGMNRSWWFVSVPIILVLGLLLLGYLQKPFWQKKIQVITNVPKPNDFFKPLYHSYGGNFKEWVKPVFSEYDYVRINSLAPMMSEKQHDILQWNNEKQSYGEEGETKQQLSRHMPQPHTNAMLHLQDAGSSQGTGHSTGHISIHTVTLSGEEFDEEVMSQRSMNTLSYQDGGSFGSFEVDNMEHAGYNLEEQHLEIHSGILQQNHIVNHLSLENILFEPRVNEPERVSLDSFSSNEPSEDGYPHVDLDTIDSGFVECSSPGVSHSSTAEQMNSDLFQEHKNSNSNYVKQWMIGSTIQEDSSSESELHETQ